MYNIKNADLLGKIYLNFNLPSIPKRSDICMGKNWIYIDKNY